MHVFVGIISHKQLTKKLVLPISWSPRRLIFKETRSESTRRSHCTSTVVTISGPGSLSAAAATNGVGEGTLE